MLETALSLTKTINVEAQLNELPGVGESCLAFTGGALRLLAVCHYIPSCDGRLDVEAARRLLSRALAPHVVRHALFVAHNSMPRTVEGAIDRCDVQRRTDGVMGSVWRCE
ncbi:hypothetical protein C7H84_35610 [Burkholderia sp. Nafp2/4-1b]|nr:hypothetical protein C7H84_35610 [Burkholderia sp. Nafp2/4-1b]